jgi:bacterioferritin-associated ferredoxin
VIVCVCQRVSDRAIAREARGGCASFDELQARLGVATGCGTCHEHAKRLFSAERAAAGEAARRAGVEPLTALALPCAS